MPQVAKISALLVVSVVIVHITTTSLSNPYGIWDEELKCVTSNFKHVVGHGGFGTVYKGVYKHVNVSVKVLNKVGR